MIARGLSRLFALPPYAATGHPAARLGYTPPLPVPQWVRLVRAFAHLSGVVLLLLIGLLAAGPGTLGIGVARFSDIAHLVLQVPSLLLAIGVMAFAYLYGTRAAALLHSGPAWDTLRTTPNGVRLALLAYQAGAIRALWRPLLLVLLFRLVLIGGLLNDLASHQGRALDLLLLGVVPTLHPSVGLLALVVGLTAALILPLALTLLACGLGMAVALLVRGRLAVLLISVALLVTVALGAVQITATRNNLLHWLTGAVYDMPGLIAAVVGGGLADHGYMLLNMGRTLAFWAAVPYGVGLAGVLLALAFLVVAIGEGLVRYAAVRARRG